MKILELFSGYGSQSLSLKYLGIEHTSDISEIDRFAIKAYNQIHGDTHNWGDITKIDEKKLPYYELITYSPPCQDFSVAGKQKGGDEGSGTRSSLLWECERIIRTVKPKYLLMENVKNIIGEKHKHNFIRWLSVLEDLGYNNYWQVLNAKDYGIPQNRERVFVVSIRKDVEKKYIFPEKKYLKLRLKNILENNKVDIESDGNLIEPKIITRNIPQFVKVRKHEVDTDKLLNLLREHKEKIKLTEKQISEKLNLPITTVKHWFRRNGCFGIPDKNVWFNLKKLLEIETDEFDLPLTEFEEKQCMFEKVNRCYDENGISPTLTTSSVNEKVITNNEVRNITPRERWRLMGVKDEDFDKLKGFSKTQLQKLSGNGIVVNVLMEVFANLILEGENNENI